MAIQDQDSVQADYPTHPQDYHILAEIGRGSSGAVVKKALCTANSKVVAIKSFPLLGPSSHQFQISGEADKMSFPSHPNLLESLCSFPVGGRLWVVTPFVAAGSLRSMIASSFPDGIPEACISVILKETLTGLYFLHCQGDLHKDIKAGNILIDSDGSIKLGDCGVSASVYESIAHDLTLDDAIDATELPYWMAPELTNLPYSQKAEIWSFGITALELAHGRRPPLSHLVFSESLTEKIAERVRFADYQKYDEKSYTNKNISQDFKDMVGLCLDQDPSKRPSADELLEHSFFKTSGGPDFLVKNLLEGLPAVEERFKATKLQSKHDEIQEVKEEGRTVGGWIFNVDEFVLDPVFVVDATQGEESDVSKASSPEIMTMIPISNGGVGVDTKLLMMAGILLMMLLIGKRRWKH